MSSLVKSRAGSGPAPRSWIERLWSSIAERGQKYVKLPNQSMPGLERAKLLAEALLSERGEASGAAVSRELQTAWQTLGTEDRIAFYQFLAEKFVPDADRLKAAACKKAAADGGSWRPARLSMSPSASYRAPRPTGSSVGVAAANSFPLTDTDEIHAFLAKDAP